MPTGTDVRVVQAHGDAKYGDQNTDGSKSIRLLLNTMREAGATARQMLVTAAAHRWNVASSLPHRGRCCRAGRAGQRLRYGELAEDAAKLPVPSTAVVQLKTRAAWRYIGKPMPIVDLDDMVRGSAVYGIDVMLPGMKHASIERPPSYGGRVKSYDDRGGAEGAGGRTCGGNSRAAATIRLPAAGGCRGDRRQHLGGDAGPAEAADPVGAGTQCRLRYHGVSRRAGGDRATAGQGCA